MEAARRRKEEEGRQRAEMARRNAQAEAREQAERQRLAALYAAVAAAGEEGVRADAAGLIAGHARSGAGPQRLSKVDQGNACTTGTCRVHSPGAPC